MAAERLTDNPRALDANANALAGATWTFYASNTTTPQAAYADAALTTPLSNPVVADAGGKFPEIYFDALLSYRGILKNAAGTTLKDIDPINAGIARSLAASSGASTIGFIQAGSGAVARTIQAKARDTLNVKDFGATGDGVTNDTAAINLAITYALTTPYQEKTLVFPAGDYWVSQIDLRGRDFLRLHAEGTVNITGNDDTAGWIIGNDRFDKLGHTTPDEGLTYGVRMSGGPWLIGPAPGENYQRGLKLQNMVDCVFENLSVSGTYTPTGGTGNRIGAELELSFNNGFYNCSFGNPGAPLGADKSYSLYMGDDNVNNNRFYNGRIVNNGATTLRGIGVRVTSSGNCFYGVDVSSAHTSFELVNASGCHFINTYHEGVSRVASVEFASTGCVFMPSYADIGANGTAYDLGGASGSIQTIGFQIIGGNHRFNASGTTGLKKGSNCYGLTYQPGLNTSLLPATMVTGTDRGSGGGTYFDGFETFAAKINFPDTPVPSNNATTLDAYVEQDLTNFGIKVGATAQTATSAVKVTKIGRTVTITGYVLMGAAVSGTGDLTITGLPYASSGTAATAVSVANLTYTGTPSGYVNGSVIELYQTTEAGTRSALTHTNLTATSEVEFSVTYTATT